MCGVLAVMQPNLKHWLKRPLHSGLVDYAVSDVTPLWDLGTRMMKSVGEAGVAGTIRMSKQSLQYYYDDADKELPDEEKRCDFLFDKHCALESYSLVLTAIL